MTPTEIDGFLKLDYNVVIHRRDNGFLLHLPELHLFAEHENLGTAFDEIELAKRNLMENYFVNESSEKIPLPNQLVKKEDLKTSLTPFFIKLGAVALVAVILIAATNISLTYSLQQGPKIIAQKAGKAAIIDFGVTLEKVVKREFTPEKEERMRLGIRKLVAALKPFINEFEPLYHND